MSLPTQAPLSARRTRWFALGAVVVSAGAIALVAWGGLGRNLVYYWGPTEVQSAGAKAVGATIRLGGMVAPGSVKSPPGAVAVDFAVTDGKASVPVRAKGAPPQMFREGIGVVVEGTMRSDGTFEGHRLMVSHGNEYRAPKAGERPDPASMMKTLQESEK